VPNLIHLHPTNTRPRTDILVAASRDGSAAPTIHRTPTHRRAALRRHRLHTPHAGGRTAPGCGV